MSEAGNSGDAAGDEIAALRAEVARLRAEAAGSADAPAPEVAKPEGTSRWRWVAFGMLVVLTAVLAIGGVAARFTSSELLDTDRYVETVEPLASDPAIQAQIVDTATEKLMERVDVDKMIHDALTGLREVAPRVPEQVVGLTPVLAGQVESFVRSTLERMVASEAFQTTWAEANRQAHDSMVAALTGRTDGSVEVSDDGTVSVSMDALIREAKELLVQRGFTFVDGLPQVNATFEVFQSADVVRAQRATSALDRMSNVLPWIALLVAGFAVWVAPRGRRRRGLVIVALAVAVAMVLLALAVAIGRSFYLSAIPTDVVTLPAAQAVFDALADPLRITFRAVFALGVVVALVAFLSGPSPAAVGLRRGVGSVRQRLDAADRTPSAPELWLGRYRVLVRIVIVAVAAMTLVFWQYPSGLVVVSVAAVAAIALLATEILGRTARDEEPAAVEP